MNNYSLLFFRYIIQKLIKSWSFWFLLLFFLCSFISAIYQITTKPEDSQYLYAWVTLLANVSFGYIAGYIFYIVSDFLPNRKNEFKALNTVLYAEYEIMSATSCIDFHKLGNINDEKIIIDYKSEYELFKLIFCEKNIYEKVNDETVRQMTKLKIYDSFVSSSRNHLRHMNSYFDLLLGELSNFLPNDEVVSLIKLKSFYSLDFAHYEDGKLYVHQYEIESVYQEYYYNKKNITDHLKERTTLCVDQELRQEIMQLKAYQEH